MKPLDALWNIFPANRTQTAYLRFLKQPGGEMRTAFTDSQLAWDKKMSDRLRTDYDSLWRGEEGVPS